MGLGPRHLFPAIPMLAACAGPVLPRVSTAWRAIVVFVSVGAAYLGAQAGIIAESNPFPYAVKTFVSGTGMSVLFKEALPALLGIETLHTVVARPDVSARDLLAMLPTHAGLVLALHQAFFLALNAATAAVLARTLVGIWRPTRAEVPACAS
jgi:hypothetical protein